MICFVHYTGIREGKSILLYRISTGFNYKLEPNGFTTNSIDYFNPRMQIFDSDHAINPGKLLVQFCYDISMH